jgi:plastocyanin
LTPRRLIPSVVLIALVVAGCGSSSKSSTSSTPAASASPTPANTGSSAAPTSSTTGGSPSSAQGSTLSLAADTSGALKYDKSSLSAKAGKLTLDFTNKSPLPHDVAIAGSGGAVVAKTATITGKSANLTADLKPGTYTFYCSVPGHRQAGMQGTLTVK